MSVKFRFRNWANFAGGDWQIMLIPHASFYYGGNLCFAVGWLFWVAEIWIGPSLDELV